MVVRFHVVAPAAKQRTFTVRLPILLGRGDEAKFRIQHDLVSRRHCELFEREGEVYVRDLGSTNGTFLNDEQVPVSTKTRVPPGGIVRVGGLAFSVDYESKLAAGGATIKGDRQGEPGTDESRVGGNAEAVAEPPDFKVEHDGEEPATAPADDVAAEAVATDTPAEAPADTQAETPTSEPVPSPEAADGFDFLSADGVASPDAEPPRWPAATDAVPDDDADDDQLNAFFKGLK